MNIQEALLHNKAIKRKNAVWAVPAVNDPEKPNDHIPPVRLTYADLQATDWEMVPYCPHCEQTIYPKC